MKVDQIEAALKDEQAFDPATADKRYSLGMTDFAAAAILPVRIHTFW